MSLIFARTYKDVSLICSDSLNTTSFGNCAVSAQCMIACTEASSNWYLLSCHTIIIGLIDKDNRQGKSDNKRAANATLNFTFLFAQ